MSTNEPTFADARAEGPHFRGEEVPRQWGMLLDGRYELFFDREFAIGTMLRSYDGVRYHRVDCIEEAYCKVVLVERDRFAACREFGPGFPFRTMLMLIEPANKRRKMQRVSG